MINFFKNFFIKTFVFLFSNKKKNLFNSNHPVFLIVTTTALGDTIWATPVIQDLKEKYKNSKIITLTSPVGYEILKNNPFIDKLYLFKSALIHVLKLVFLLKKEKIQKVLILHASQRIIFPLCLVLQAQEIISTKGRNKGLDSLFSLTPDDNSLHEVLRRYAIAKIEPISTLKYFEEEEEKISINNLLNEINFNTRFVVIHPGATDTFRIWPKEHFKKLVNLFITHTDYKIIITGSKKEIPLCNFILSSYKNCISLSGKLSIRQLASLINKSSLLVVDDTGPLHIACAFNSPVLGIFSPSNPARYGPYKANNAHVIYKSAPCFNCIKRKCQNPFCLEKILPEEVFKRSLEILETTDNKKIYF